MADLNSWNITGRLTKDATVKEINGKTLLEADVANNVGYGDFAKTNWVKIKMWGDRSRNIIDLLKKGSVIAVSGELTTDTWQTKEGQDRTNLILTVNKIDILYMKKNNSKNEESLPSYDDDTHF